MSRPRNPNTVRRGYTRRDGTPVRAARIKGRQAPKRRLNAGAVRRAKRKPMLLAAGTLFGLGALDAILTGRWGGFLVLGIFAGGFLIGHLAWSHHKNRQARKPARVSAAEQRRQALAKAREQQERTAMAAERKRAWSKEGLKEFVRGDDPEPAGTHSNPPASPTYQQPPPLQASEASEARMKQRRYDEMQSMLARQRKRGQPERVWPEQYEEFYEGPGKVKPRPPGPSASKPHAWPDMGPGNLDYSLLSSDDPATHRFFQLRQSGYTGPIDKNGDPVTDADLARETARRRGEKPREGAK